MRIAETVIVCILTAVAAEARPLPQLIATLDRAGAKSDHLEIVRTLDEIRRLGPEGAPAAEAVSRLLPHRADLYRDRDKIVVTRLRTHLFVTLGVIGVPDSAIPALYDTLGHVDERLNPREVAAAARAVRSLGVRRGADFAPFLVEALALQINGEEEFSLDRYDTDFPPEETTTVQLEAIRALAAVAPADANALRMLQSLAVTPAGADVDSRVAREAALVVRSAEGARP